MLRLIVAGEAPPAILVGVWNSGADRFRDYMPRQAVAGDRVAPFHNMPGEPVAALQSDAYLRFLVQELKPFIDATYRTRPDAADTFVMGSSMGGLISAYAVCEYPEVFGGAGCVSTHWPAGDGGMIDYLARKLPPPATHKFYFDYGTTTLDATYAPLQAQADVVLRAAGYTPGPLWTTRVFPGAAHNEAAWQARAEIPLRFLLQDR